MSSFSSTKFFDSKHVEYVIKISKDTESFEHVVSQYLRMSGVYWGLTATCVLGRNIVDEMDSDMIVEWVLNCQNSDGGFSGFVGHDSHMLYTLSALQILAICKSLDKIDKSHVANYISSLQQKDGSFYGDQWGEVDTRFSYCAVSAMAILGLLRCGSIDVDMAVEFVARCKNFDGGFGAVPGAESHAGQIFCCVGALSICEALDKVDIDLLGWWLSERQCDSGGLNGRPEKQADVCYSWWILSCLSIIGRISWIDKSALAEFILQCQDADDGGIADRPGNMADIFHTFFGISGLSLMGCFEVNNTNSLLAIDDKEDEGGSNTSFSHYRTIDPTYALPTDIVELLGLPHQRLPQI